MRRVVMVARVLLLVLVVGYAGGMASASAFGAAPKGGVGRWVFVVVLAAGLVGGGHLWRRLRRRG